MRHYKLYHRNFIDLIINDQTDFKNIDYFKTALIKSFYKTKNIFVYIEDYKTHRTKYKKLFELFKELHHLGYEIYTCVEFANLDSFLLAQAEICASRTIVPYFDSAIIAQAQLDSRLTVKVNYDSVDSIKELFNLLTQFNIDLTINWQDQTDQEIVLILLELLEYYTSNQLKQSSITNLNDLGPLYHRPRKHSSFAPKIILKDFGCSLDDLAFIAIEEFKQTSCEECVIRGYCGSTLHNTIGSNRKDNCDLLKRLVLAIKKGVQ